MGEKIKVAMIGLDTSHTVEFTRRMQAPDCPQSQKVEGLRVVTCLRFATPFQDEEGLEQRQQQLEKWGVKVTDNFAEAVKNCDAIMMEINDPAYHLPYFQKCMELNKPIFLDKPLADNLENGKKMIEMARQKEIRLFSSSSLRFVTGLDETLTKVEQPLYSHMYGPLGKAPAGSSIVWYGVHAFEMLEKVMEPGAKSVYTRKDDAGVVIIVTYPEKRRGVVELIEGAYVYGGCVRTDKSAEAFQVDTSKIYNNQLEEIGRFFKGDKPPLELEDILEVMALLDAGARSLKSGEEETL